MAASDCSPATPTDPDLPDSGIRLLLGDRYTIMKDRKKEIGPGLLKKMLTDLGLEKSDIEQ